MVVVSPNVEKALKKLIEAIEKSSHETPEGHKYILLSQEFFNVKGAVSDLHRAVNPSSKARLHRARNLGVIINDKSYLTYLYLPIAIFNGAVRSIRKVLECDERFVVSGQHVFLARHGKQERIFNPSPGSMQLQRAYLKLRKAIEGSELETKSGCKYLLIFNSIFKPNSPLSDFYREVRNAVNLKDIPEKFSGALSAAHVGFFRNLFAHLQCTEQANGLHISGQVVGLAEHAEELDKTPAALLTRSVESARGCVQMILEHQNQPRCITFYHPVFRAAALLNVEVQNMWWGLEINCKDSGLIRDFEIGLCELQKRALLLLYFDEDQNNDGEKRKSEFGVERFSFFSIRKATKVLHLLDDPNQSNKKVDIAMSTPRVGIAFLVEDGDEVRSLASFVRDICNNEYTAFCKTNRMPVRPSCFDGYSRSQRKKLENGYRFLSYLEAETSSVETESLSCERTLHVFESAVEMLDEVQLLPSSVELISATPEHIPNDHPVSARRVPDTSTKTHYLRCASEHLTDSRPRLKAALDALGKYQEISDDSDVTAADDSFAHVCHILALAYAGFVVSKKSDTLIGLCFGLLGRLDENQANSLRVLLLYCRCVVLCKQHRYTEMKTVKEELDAGLVQGLNEWDHFAVEALSIAANLVGLEMGEDRADTLRAMLGKLQVVEPDAVCLASHCENKDIYHDCGYFGHVLLLCCAGCKLTYHFRCLKQLRSGITKEKEFGDLHLTACLTDGCEGTIVYGCIYKSDENSAMSPESKIVEKKYFGSKDEKNRKRQKSKAREARRRSGGESAASASCNSATEHSLQSSPTEEHPGVGEDEVIVKEPPVAEEDTPCCSSSLPSQPLKLTEQFGLESFKRIETKKKLSEQEDEVLPGKNSKKNKNKKKQILIDLKPFPVLTNVSRSTSDFTEPTTSNEYDVIPPNQVIEADQIEMACDDVLMALGAAEQPPYLSFIDDAAFFQDLRECYLEFSKEIDRLDYPSVLESDKRLTVVGVQPCVLVGFAADSEWLILVAASAWRQHIDRKMMDTFISTMRERRDLQQFSNDDYESLVYALRDELRIVHKIPESKPVDSRVILSCFCNAEFTTLVSHLHPYNL